MVEKDPQGALDVGELDLLIDSIEPWKVESIGNQAWIDWHIRLHKLHQQVALEASCMLEKLTIETLILSGKMPILVYEAICIQVWRLKILPQIMKIEQARVKTFSIYTVFYHEAATIGLLQTVLSCVDGAQWISEVAGDLLDYSVEQLTALLALINNGYLSPRELDCKTAAEELERQRQDLQFEIGIRCISIVRYLVEDMETAGIGALISTSLYKSYDVPSLLAHLLQVEPWRRTNSNEDVEVFKSGRWVRPTKEVLSKMQGSEVQLWLCLSQLLLEPRLSHYYTIEETRRTHFCRLQEKITEPILDQIPSLGDLKRFLCSLSVGDYSSLNCGNGVKNPGCTLIEVVPQIKHSYLKEVHKRTKAIAKTQISLFTLDCSNESRQLAKKLTKSYTSNAGLILDNGGAKCGRCGEKASKKCSRCKTEWYCGRECQVQQWPKHKEICDEFKKMAV